MALKSGLLIFSVFFVRQRQSTGVFAQCSPAPKYTNKVQHARSVAPRYRKNAARSLANAFVTSPSFDAVVHGNAGSLLPVTDLLEEIARIYGYTFLKRH